MTGVFSTFFKKECFRCLVDATPSRTELQVSPCWQLLTSQVVWFFPFFLFYFWYSFSLFCLVFVQRRVFLVSGDWGAECGYLGIFLRRIHTASEVAFPFVQSIQRRFPFCPWGRLPACWYYCIPHDRPNRSTVWRKKNVFTTGFKVRLNWRISFQDRE
jgi:hypothetical protein